MLYRKQQADLRWKLEFLIGRELSMPKNSSSNKNCNLHRGISIFVAIQNYIRVTGLQKLSYSFFIIEQCFEILPL